MKDLFDAIREQDLEKVKGLTQFITNTESYNITQNIIGEKHTPLTYAISQAISSKKGSDIVEALLESGADQRFEMSKPYVVTRFIPALKLAVQAKNLELIKMLLFYPSIVDENMLIEIYSNVTNKTLKQDLSITNCLLSRAIDIQLEPQRLTTLVNSILEKSINKSPEKIKPFLQSYLKFGIKLEIGFKELILLHFKLQGPVTLFSIREIITILLDLKTNPDFPDEEGYTPLNQACRRGDKEIITIFLEKGANPNIADKQGTTPLMTLISSSNLSKTDEFKMVKLLLEKGAVPSMPDNLDNLPIHKAIEKKKFNIVRLFLEKTPELRNLDAKTLKLLSEADPELLAKSGIHVDNRFKPKIVEQDSDILTKLINLLSRVKLILEEKLFNMEKFFDESSVDNSHITVSLVDSVRPTQGESLPNQPDTSLGRPIQNSNEQSK